MVSESSGRNKSERTTGLETVYPRGRAFLHEAKAAWNVANWPKRRNTLAGLERQHEDKDALSNWRNPTRPGREIDGSKGSRITGRTRKSAERREGGGGASSSDEARQCPWSEEALLFAM